VFTFAFDSVVAMAPERKTQGREDPTSRHKDVLVYEAPPFFAENSNVPQWVQNLLTDVFSFVTVHYFVWSWPFLALFYFLHKVSPPFVQLRHTRTHMVLYWTCAAERTRLRVCRDGTFVSALLFQRRPENRKGQRMEFLPHLEPLGLDKQVPSVRSPASHLMF
jgi:hypothetical protein